MESAVFMVWWDSSTAKNGKSTSCNFFMYNTSCYTTEFRLAGNQLDSYGVTLTHLIILKIANFFETKQQNFLVCCFGL